MEVGPGTPCDIPRDSSSDWQVQLPGQLRQKNEVVRLTFLAFVGMWKTHIYTTKNYTYIPLSNIKILCKETGRITVQHNQMCLCSQSLLMNGFKWHQIGCLGLGWVGRGPGHCWHASSITRTLLNLMMFASSVAKYILYHPLILVFPQHHQCNLNNEIKEKKFPLCGLVSELHCETNFSTVTVEIRHCLLTWKKINLACSLSSF